MNWESKCVQDFQKEVEKNGLRIPDSIAKLFKSEMDAWQKVKVDRVDIAITGLCGAGKSSFINTIRGFCDDDENAAEVGVTQTTAELKEYYHPKNSKIKFWDFPAMGTPLCPDVEAFCNQFKLEGYDLFLILINHRVTEHDLKLAWKINSIGKNFFFVHTKIDDVVRAAKRKRSFNEEALLQKTRADCLNNLGDLPSNQQDIFLISSHSPDKWDFSRLTTAILEALQRCQRESLALTLTRFSTNIVKQKVDILKGRTWMVATASAAAAVVPLLKLMEDLEENFQTQLSEMQQGTENSQRQLRELEQRDENSQRQLREMQQREENSQRQLSEMQQREENIQRQLREMQQRVENSQIQLVEMQQRDENSQRQLLELEQREENFQRQLVEMQQREETSQRQLRENRQLLANCQGQVMALRSSREWVIRRNEIQITDNCLGRGGWGSVYEGTYCGCTVAVKQIHDLILSPHNIRLFEREMNIASKCRHPHLLQFICATKDEGNPLFVTELMEKSLRALLEQRQLSETEIAVISLDVACGLNYLHQKKPAPIIHRDVSSANVLLWRQGDQWRGKVSDYGTANFMHQTMTKAPGAMIYSAPEALTPNQTVKIDVYSFGVLLCEMCIRELPNPECREEQVTLVTNAVLSDMVRRCLEADPDTRPTMQEIIDELKEFNPASERHTITRNI